jgi:hypothetical protein
MHDNLLLLTVALAGSCAVCPPDEIRKPARLRFRPPGRRATKLYGESTLQRRPYAYRRGGLEDCAAVHVMATL